MSMHKKLTTALRASVIVVAALGAAACTTTATTPRSTDSGQMSKHEQIDAGATSTLQRLYTAAPAAREEVANAKAVLVFPSVVSAGFIFGGQYGEGKLLTPGMGAHGREMMRSGGYYKTVGGSFGLQAGAQSKALIFVFKTQEALDKFRSVDGWSLGGDASVAALKIGANGNIDTNTVRAPVEAFALTNAGLMGSLSLEGVKISPLRH